MRTINLKREKPDLDTARKRLIAELEAARKQEQRVIKIMHVWDSSGKGGSLQVGIRKSFRLRMKEGKVRCFLPGERFSQDTNEGRELLKRHPQLRRDIDVPAPFLLLRKPLLEQLVRSMILSRKS